MAKKTKDTSAGATAPENTSATATGTTTATTPKKKTKTVVELPQTPAQIAAKEALEKANEEARQDLLKNSGPKLEAAQAKLAKSKEAFETAKAELKELNELCGIKPAARAASNGTANHFTFVKDFPEGSKHKGQMVQILEIIKAAGKDGIGREPLIATMKETITSTMDYSRLLSFYQRPLREEGLITTRAESPAPAKKAA